MRKDDTDGFRENLYLNRSDTSRKDETTLRLKLDFDLDRDLTAKVLLSQVDMDDPADIWTIDGSLINEPSIVQISAGSSIST